MDVEETIMCDGEVRGTQGIKEEDKGKEMGRQGNRLCAFKPEQRRKEWLPQPPGWGSLLGDTLRMW